MTKKLHGWIVKWLIGWEITESPADTIGVNNTSVRLN